MTTRTIWVRGALLSALMLGMLVTHEAEARGSRGGGGHSRGHASRPPRVSAPHHSSRAPAAHKAPAPKSPRMPRAAAPPRTNVARVKPHPNTVQPHPRTTTPSVAGRAATPSVAGRAATSVATPTRTTTATHGYTYGAGTQARRYKAHGYGRGYRNRYVGGRRGYGRSQGNNRAIVSRLRSVHSALARLDHDYKGHRVRAMRSISMAIRQLSHRSMNYRGMGGLSAMNRGIMRTRNGNAGRRVQHLSQNQSDARMSQALRNLQGIAMQLGNQGYQTSGHARARGHVQNAIGHLNTALSIR